MPNEGQSGRDLVAELAPLAAELVPEGRLLAVVPLGVDTQESSRAQKGAGYGQPLRLELAVGAERKILVLHTATSNEFGHDRRADRAAEMLLAFDTVNAVPRHVRVLDVGAYLESGGFLSLRSTGEFYCVTSWAEGRPYAEDLRRIAEVASASDRDHARMVTLARHLAELHSESKRDPVAHRRAVRDLFGSGEGIFGIIDGYPPNTPGAPQARLDALERLALEYRPRLRARPGRLTRVHGDYHPWNLVFDEEDRLTALDASRGCLGDPADDVTCLAINYLFFGVLASGAARSAFLRLFRSFFDEYFAARSDPELLEAAPPYLAWRALVLASPRWYPDVTEAERDRLLGFVESTLRARRLDLVAAEELLR